MMHNALSFLFVSILLLGGSALQANDTPATPSALAKADTTDERTPVGLEHRDRLPSEDDQVRPEYVLTYVSASWCIVAQRDRHDTIRAFIDEHREKAKSQDRVFVTRGVALDSDPEEGFSYLQSITDFHEVSSGQHWLNQEALRFIWGDNDLNIEPGIPIFVIQERDIVSDVVSDGPTPESSSAVGDPRTLRVEEDTIVDVYWGLDEIEAALEE